MLYFIVSCILVNHMYKIKELSKPGIYNYNI